jgi:diadenylate cyclase
LSEDSTLSPELGTRHRAAVGLTEQTDAAVVVVSEEHGKISLVVDGKVTQNLDEPQLRSALKRLVAP